MTRPKSINGGGILCPYCGHDHSEIRSTSRIKAGILWRQRLCRKCFKKFRTQETVIRNENKVAEMVALFASMHKQLDRLLKEVTIERDTDTEAANTGGNSS